VKDDAPLRRPNKGRRGRAAAARVVRNDLMQDGLMDRHPMYDGNGFRPDGTGMRDELVRDRLVHNRTSVGPMEFWPANGFEGRLRGDRCWVAGRVLRIGDDVRRMAR
jgi:hypothetical protein